MRILLAVMLIFSIFLPVKVMAFDGNDTQITRYLESINFATSYRQSVNLRMQSAGSNNVLLKNLSDLSDKQIYSVLVPIVRTQLSDGDAQILANFFESDVGHALKSGKQLSPEQQASENKFLSEHRDLVAKMNKFFRLPDVQRQIITGLMNETVEK